MALREAPGDRSERLPSLIALDDLRVQLFCPLTRAMVRSLPTCLSLFNPKAFASARRTSTSCCLAILSNPPSIPSRRTPSHLAGGRDIIPDSRGRYEAQTTSHPSPEPAAAGFYQLPREPSHHRDANEDAASITSRASSSF